MPPTRATSLLVRPLEPGLVDLVRHRVTAHRRAGIRPAPGTRRAAVAIVVVTMRDQPSVLLIKRAASGRNAGQWALPGGRLEPRERAVVGAVREAEEEIGLTARDVTVLGRLDDFGADSGFAITPVVVVTTAPIRLRRQAEEVAAIHPIPLHRLCADDLPHWRERPGMPPLLQMPLRRGLVVHAPTGALLWHFREVVLLGRPHRLGAVAQPDFTRH